jgi:acetylornithine deacetylase/succinyl-diaminopimelate desuccinylase-like protein
MSSLIFVLCMAVSFMARPARPALARQDARYDGEIRVVATRPEVQQALQVIRELESRTLQDHILLTEIPAPPFMEAERARRYADMLRQAGADSVAIDEEGNVIALRRGAGGGRVVAIAGHMDTVFPEGTDVTVRRRGDTLRAPGIGDDTRGLVVVLTVLRALDAARVLTDADLLFIGTVGEEGLGDLRGVKHLFRENGPRIDSWIAVDGGGVGRIVHRGLGSHRYRVTFKGPGGHSWGAFGLGNPSHALSRAVHYFDESAAGFVAQGARTSYNIGRIGGGTSVNSIPFEAWMEVDMRSESPERLASIDSIFHEVINRSIGEQNDQRLDGPPLTVEIEMIGDRPSGVLDQQAEIVQRAMASARFLGVEPRLSIASTDSNLPIALGKPAVTIGRGGAGGGGHSPGEWWVNENGYLAIQNALLILLAEAGRPSPLP